MASVEELLSATNLATSVDVQQLLSSEYDDDLSASGDLEYSGDLATTFASEDLNLNLTNPPTPGAGLTQALQKQSMELSDLEREQRRRHARTQPAAGSQGCSRRTQATSLSGRLELVPWASPEPRRLLRVVCVAGGA